MRRKIQTILLILLCGFCIIVNTYAVENTKYSDINDNVNSKYFLVCEYKNESNSNNDSVKIYESIASYEDKKTGNNFRMWYIFDSKNDGKFTELGSSGSSINSAGSFTEAFNAARVHKTVTKNRWKAEDEKTFVCPKYAYIDAGGILDNEELCLTSAANACENDGKFNRGVLMLTQNEDSIYIQADRKMAEIITNGLTYENVDKGITSEIFNNAVDQTIKYIYEKYYSNLADSNYYKETIPENIKNYLENESIKSEIINNTVKNKTEEIKSQIKNKINTGEISQEKGDQLLNNVDGINEAYEVISRLHINIDGPAGCANIFGDTKIISNIFNTIQYAGPILVAIFTIIELAKAAISGNQEDLKKIYPRFTKRLIAAILLFFIPLFIKLLFKIILEIDVDTICI